MKKGAKHNDESSIQGRVLARCLAEDLRNIHAGKTGSVVIRATTTVTTPDDGPRDITNVGGDGDLMDL